MNSVVEKLAAIEKEVADIQPKMVPLTERIADLDQKVAAFAQQLTGLAEESAAVKQDIELAQKSFSRIQTLIGESKVESEQLVAGQEENQQRCETMTAVFGAAFQAVSQFFETAQRMGLTDQAKAVFLASPSEQAMIGEDSLPSAVSNAMKPPIPEHVAEAIPPEPPIPEPVAEAITPETTIPEPVAEAIPPETTIPEPVAEAMLPEPTEAESILSESDFDAVISGTSDKELDSWSVPGLPDVATPPVMEMVSSDDSDTDAELSGEMASHLDVQPLNLGVPALPAQDESTDVGEKDEEEIEALLATMMEPVTVGGQGVEG